MTKGFTRGQQKVYRPLVDAAWRQRCRETRTIGNLADAVAKDVWYRNQLLDECGIYTTKQADRVKDFDKLIVHFEALSHSGIYWSLRVIHNDVRVARKLLNDHIREFDVDVDYVRGIARKAGYSAALESIEDASQLLSILQTLKQRIPVAA
jgi:hypothetical protein